MDEDIPDLSKDVEPKPRITPSECKICGAPALYKYFGATSCHACKIFFKRNAQKGLESMKCESDGNCPINTTNRHICSFCRLNKCFTSGMQIEMIRCSRKSTTRKSRSKKPLTTDEENQPYAVQISNLLDLNPNERDLLLKLTHCYEEYNILSHVQQFAQEQSSLPIKLRYKIASLDTLFRSIFDGIKLFFKLNHECFSSYSNNLPNLLRCAMENAGNLTVALFLHEIPLYLNLDSTKSVPWNLPKEITDDVIFIQLGIAMFVFSTTNCTDYSAVSVKEDSTCIKEISRIQDFYTDVTWKYLVSKYDHVQAVTFFSYFIKSLVVINSVIMDIHQSEQHQRLMENLAEKINQQIIG